MSTEKLALIALLAFALITTTGCPSDVMSTGPAPTASKGNAKKASQKASALPARLIDVKISPEEGLADHAPTVQDAQGWLREAMIKTDVFQKDAAPSQTTATARGSYRAGHQKATDGTDRTVGAVFFEVTVTLKNAKGRELGQYSTEAFVGDHFKADKDAPKPDQALKTLVQEVAAEVAQSLAVQTQIEHCDDKTLVAMLDPKGNKDTMDLVVREIRTRRPADATKPLVAMLKHPERDIVNIAASTLGDVGTRDAVPALLDRGSRVEPLDRLPVLYALGKLGGPQAIVYLETLSKEPLPPMVIQAVQRALKEARQGAP